MDINILMQNKPKANLITRKLTTQTKSNIKTKRNRLNLYNLFIDNIFWVYRLDGIRYPSKFHELLKSLFGRYFNP